MDNCNSDFDWKTARYETAEQELKKRDARIAELERLRSEDHSHALDLAAEIERMTKRLEEARKDADRLDFIESMGNGAPWIARQSSLGRGYRLHNDKHGTHITARGAIDAAIKEQT